MREAGYYWCNYKGEWTIYYWNFNYKLFMQMDIEFEESEFDEIDEKQIKRE